MKNSIYYLNGEVLMASGQLSNFKFFPSRPLDNGDSDFSYYRVIMSVHKLNMARVETPAL